MSHILSKSAICTFRGFVFQHLINNLNLRHVNYEMFCEISLVLVIFAALITLETFFSTMRPNVTLQIARRSASVVALVTLEWLFSCMLPHHVNFQFTSCNAGKLAHCASVRLFPRVGSFVPLQVT